ncbi:MAG: hypothetical protein PHY63_04485, partial [Candidatus Cloacimonetes bacterium]|nr:hypothetical protein [Candidatus Cloacimonadota bacterium]
AYVQLMSSLCPAYVQLMSSLCPAYVQSWSSVSYNYYINMIFNSKSKLSYGLWNRKKQGIN